MSFNLKYKVQFFYTIKEHSCPFTLAQINFSCDDYLDWAKQGCVKWQTSTSELLQSQMYDGYFTSLILKIVFFTVFTMQNDSNTHLFFYKIQPAHLFTIFSSTFHYELLPLLFNSYVRKTIYANNLLKAFHHNFRRGSFS